MTPTKLRLNLMNPLLREICIRLEVEVIRALFSNYESNYASCCFKARQKIEYPLAFYLELLICAVKFGDDKNSYSADF